MTILPSNPLRRYYTIYRMNATTVKNLIQIKKIKQVLNTPNRDWAIGRPLSTSPVGVCLGLCAASSVSLGRRGGKTGTAGFYDTVSSLMFFS